MWFEQQHVQNYGSPSQAEHENVVSLWHNPEEPLIIDESLFEDLKAAMHPSSTVLQADGPFEEWLIDELDQLVLGLLDLYLSAKCLMDEFIYRHSYVVAECIQFIKFLRKAKLDVEWVPQFGNFKAERLTFWTRLLGKIFLFKIALTVRQY